eukprot:CAMPEP_0201613192 /NCGR_PEP_ID=MMETSP0492-20130828/25249_1 /ASSEMBLY_ACC=CAM_ASM_000837 /TAXON_ID=420259 /ORGANISM="Thalassiosira gravida, Strain GMp14c1" /LENGTH=99 /DNA_ID=CAMNT_0048079981 /DNA_START=50 /DNA_END=345 /DNA_ORIENTATION=-
MSGSLPNRLPHKRPPRQLPSSSLSASSLVGRNDTMITIDDNNGSTITPEMMYKTRTIVTPCTDNDVESILSDAERNARSELRSTSEILKLAGCVLRDRA